MCSTSSEGFWAWPSKAGPLEALSCMTHTGHAHWGCSTHRGDQVQAPLLEVQGHLPSSYLNLSSQSLSTPSAPHSFPGEHLSCSLVPRQPWGSSSGLGSFTPQRPHHLHQKPPPTTTRPSSCWKSTNSKWTMCALEMLLQDDSLSSSFQSDCTPSSSQAETLLLLLLQPDHSFQNGNQIMCPCVHTCSLKTKPPQWPPSPCSSLILYHPAPDSGASFSPHPSLSCPTMSDFHTRSTCGLQWSSPSLQSPGTAYSSFSNQMTHPFPRGALPAGPY